MEFAIFVWLASVVGNLSAFFGMTATACLFMFFCMTVGVAMHNDLYSRDKKTYTIRTGMGKLLMSYVVVAYIIAALIPSQKTMYLMAGAYGSQKVVQSEAADKVVKIVNSKLDEYLEEAEKTLKK